MQHAVCLKKSQNEGRSFRIALLLAKKDQYYDNDRKSAPMA